MPLSPLLSFQAKARDADILVGITRSIPVFLLTSQLGMSHLFFLQEITIYANPFY